MAYEPQQVLHVSFLRFWYRTETGKKLINKLMIVMEAMKYALVNYSFPKLAWSWRCSWINIVILQAGSYKSIPQQFWTTSKLQCKQTNKNSTPNQTLPL